jgi:hypothetical protein
MITPNFSLTATERVLPRLALDFTTAILDSRITFTRAGNTATRVNGNGYIENSAENVARFDFDPIALTCKGLLIEESRTNLILQSEDFSTTWSLTNATAVADEVLAPDNQLTADMVTATGATAVIAQSVAKASSAITYTASIFVKGNSSVFTLSLDDTNASNRGRVELNLNTGDIGNITASGTFTNASASVSSYANGFYRLVLTVTSSAASTVRMRPFFTTTSSVVYLWGAQLEAGAFATSYIPTVSSQVTRTADVATMTGTNFSDWYSAGAGGVVARVLPSTVSGTRPALQFDDATADEVIALRGETTNPELVIVDGGSPQAQIDAGTIAANTAYNLGAAWNTDNCAAAVNGGAAVTDTSATIPTVTQARLGSNGINYLNGHLQTARYWPQRIINAEVQAFSK